MRPRWGCSHPRRARRQSWLRGARTRTRAGAGGREEAQDSGHGAAAAGSLDLNAGDEHVGGEEPPAAGRVGGQVPVAQGRAHRRGEVEGVGPGQVLGLPRKALEENGGDGDGQVEFEEERQGPALEGLPVVVLLHLLRDEPGTIKGTNRMNRRGGGGGRQLGCLITSNSKTPGFAHEQTKHTLERTGCSKTPGPFTLSKPGPLTNPHLVCPSHPLRSLSRLSKSAMASRPVIPSTPARDTISNRVTLQQSRFTFYLLRGNVRRAKRGWGGKLYYS